LCDTYWQPEIQKRIASETKSEEKPFIDVEASITRRHGPKRWDIAIGAGADQIKGLLRTGGDLDFQPGQKLRILDVAQAVSDAESDGVRCLTVGMFSEVYVVTSTSH
jgi:hypothetical protein